MKIIADSASLYSVEEGAKIGVIIVPACVVINGETYRDYEDISCEEFIKLINEGGVPTSSQPAIGDIIDIFENSDEEIIFLPVGDGLSGTYQSAVAVKNNVENNSHIHVINTKTLAGPQRYMVQKALQLREKGLNAEEIEAELNQCVESSQSYVIPFDFGFLKRSGRLTPLAAKIGGMIKIVPVMTQTEEKTRITPFTIKRSKKRAVQAVIDHLKSSGVDEHYIISVGHGGAPETAQEVYDQIRAQITDADMEIVCLAPALITHGGPGCVTIQVVKK